MKKNKPIYPALVLIAALTFFIACETIPTEPLEARLGYAYYPVDTGKFVVYEVLEQRYSLTAPLEEERYQIKERVANNFIDLSGEPAQRIERYRRRQVTQEWRIDSVWISKRTPQMAIKTESNVPLIKLVFPIAENKTWNGNARNTLGEQIFRMHNIHKPLRLRNMSFNRTLQVTQQFDSSLVGLNKKIEIFAEDVGLIYKENTFVTYCSTPNCLGRGQISFGNVIIHRAIQYGKD